MTTTEHTSWVPAPRILDGDPTDIEKALDALPTGAIVKSSPEAIRHQEAHIWVRESNPMMLGHIAWRGTGKTTLHGPNYLAKYCAPLTVIA